jgi:hypothetical protein
MFQSFTGSIQDPAPIERRTFSFRHAPKAFRRAVLEMLHTSGHTCTFFRAADAARFDLTVKGSAIARVERMANDWRVAHTTAE